jgi:tetratricopeptide (TPR) repeat protein
MSRPAQLPIPRARLWVVGALALLVCVTFIVYFPAIRGGFVWDDDAHVTKPELRSLHGLWRIWFEVGVTQQYYPLVHSVFWLEHRLWGDNPFGYHLVNILLHAFAACLVCLLLRRLKIPGAYLAAAIFALHPVHVESVAWITELKNTLSAVFYLGAAIVYLRFDRERRTRWYLGALGLFLLALMSKTVTGTLPGALLVVLWWQRGRLSAKKDMLPLVPFVLAGAGGGMITAWWELSINSCVGPEFDFTAVERLLLAGRAVWFHAWKLVWPTRLTFIYPRWQLDSSVWWQYLFPVGLAGLAAVLWALRKRSRAPLAALLYFVGTLFPVLGFFNLYTFKYSLIADHYQYLASLGVITLAAAGIALGLARLPHRTRRAGYAGAVVLVGALAILTWRQSRIYRDAETLYRDILEKNTTCWLACNNLGNLLVDTGRTGEAIELLERALRLRPDLPHIHNNLGNAMTKVDRIPEAIEQFEQALKLRPDYVAARNNLAFMLVRQDRTSEAIEQFNEVLRLQPGDPAAHFNLANVLAGRGRLGEAVEQYGQAIGIRSDYVEAHNNLGVVLLRQGRAPEAIEQYRQALRLRPDLAEGHFNLGMVLADTGSLPEAIGEYNEAIRLRPVYAEAHNALGVALARADRLPEALRHFEQAVRIRPDFEEARVNLRKAQEALRPR